MDEISPTELRKKGYKPAPKCPNCGKTEWKYLIHKGEMDTIYLLATCSCRTQMMWRDNCKIWQKIDPAQIMGVHG